jgi:hypothetical protein
MLKFTIRKKEVWFLIWKYISCLRRCRVYSNFGQFETGTTLLSFRPLSLHFRGDILVPCSAEASFAGNGILRAVYLYVATFHV